MIMYSAESISVAVIDIFFFVFQSQALEKKTRTQSSNQLWFTHRAGRVTASKFRSAAHTNAEKPAPSLVKQICYPLASSFSTTATR